MALITMMTRALSALLVAGSFSLGAAAPVDQETTERVSYKDKARVDIPTEDGWVELASPTPASHGREYIAVAPDAGPFVRLRLDADAGRLIVLAVRIDYRDGTRRTVRIDKVLAKQRPTYVDLKGPRRIERVVVTTEGSKKATYTVHAQPVRSTGVASR